MSDGVDLEIVKKTQHALGKYVKKPPLSEKLLSKPPFRFLHDVIVAVIKNTGFLKDLFNQDELIADNVKEREAKLAFLNKLIDAVKNITNTDLKVRASKIIAGAQPNETNLLLQAIAQGIEKKLDSSEYVKQLKNSQSSIKNDQAKPKRSSSKEIKLNKSPKDEKSPTEHKNKENRNRSKVREPSKERKIPSKENVKDKKEKKISSVSSSRTNKSDSKTKKTEKLTAKTKDVIDSPESISKTSENASIKETYSEKDEVENKATPTIDDPSNNLESIKESVAREETVLGDDDRPKTRDIQSGYLSKMGKDKQEEEGNDEVRARKTDVNNGRADIAVVENDKNTVTPVARQMSARPKSARPKSGEFKEKNEKYSENQKKRVEGQDVTENIVLQTSSSVQRPKSSLRPPSVRPSSARPGAPRLRPDSALPIHEVVPMGKINVIVENLDNDGEDEDTVVIHNAAEEQATAEPIADLPAKNQSHLVEQILDQIKENEDLPKSKADIDWEQDNLRGRDTTSKEMNQLRNLIQSFTKSANPLGKLLNYLHEDIETMHAELQQWTKIKSQLFAEIAKQEKLKLEMEKPLQEKLENLKQEIAKQEQEIVDVRANIIRNDIRIRELINK
ncbi:TRAF3-interacting protein 1 [Coccinella septempunctata]|uniref:TRAF3-interacting protein 1 n=1 Tax=Coccinella septempunctata TaxID=41139 RepID=UPI001D09820E|nr:TRAF3-interacting protein 1 [Coccinella septempunctata]